MRRLFCPNSSDSPQKVFIQAETQFSCLISIRFLTNFHCQCRWGAIFVFSAKIALKSAMHRIFWILFRLMGGARAPPGYVTGSVEPTHFFCKTALLYCVRFERKRGIGSFHYISKKKFEHFYTQPLEKSQLTIL